MILNVLYMAKLYASLYVMDNLENNQHFNVLI